MQDLWKASAYGMGRINRMEWSNVPDQYWFTDMSCLPRRLVFSVGSNGGTQNTVMEFSGKSAESLDQHTFRPHSHAQRQEIRGQNDQGRLMPNQHSGAHVALQRSIGTSPDPRSFGP